MIQMGLKGKSETVVTDRVNTAEAMGSGDLPVFATPAMVALMEEAAMKSLQSELLETESTVGTLMQITHMAATPVGARVYAESLVEAVEGRKIRIKVSAFDKAGLIGEGWHERVIVDRKRFLDKVQSKALK